LAGEMHIIHGVGWARATSRTYVVESGRGSCSSRGSGPVSGSSGLAAPRIAQGTRCRLSWQHHGRHHAALLWTGVSSRSGLLGKGKGAAGPSPPGRRRPSAPARWGQPKVRRRCAFAGPAQLGLTRGSVEDRESRVAAGAAWLAEPRALGGSAHRQALLVGEDSASGDRKTGDRRVPRSPGAPPSPLPTAGAGLPPLEFFDNRSTILCAQLPPGRCRMARLRLQA
jgi:hypothetical protein